MIALPLGPTGEAPPVHSGFYEGPVLLARHPIHDPDCLVRFQAVCPPELKVGPILYPR